MSFEMSSYIYQKYYEGAQEAGLIWTLPEWYAKRNPQLENETDEEYEIRCDEFGESFEHSRALQTVLMYELSYWVFRHLNGPWGEVTDFFIGERNHFCNDYREKTGYQLEGNIEDEIRW